MRYCNNHSTRFDGKEFLESVSKLRRKENVTGNLEIGVSLKRRPLPGRRERVPCILYFVIVAHTVCFEMIYSSAARTLATYAYDNCRSNTVAQSVVCYTLITPFSVCSFATLKAELYKLRTPLNL